MGSGDFSFELIKHVSAINLKQVEVQFNNLDDVDMDELTDEANYTLENDDKELAVADAMVDGDNVVLTLDTAAENQDELTLTMDEAVIGEEVESTVEFFDTTIPEVTGAEVVGSKSVKVMFTEPINTDATADVRDAFELNDGSEFVRSVDFNDNETEAIVTFYSDLDEGTQELSVSNDLEDYAGYSVVPQTLDVEVVEDTEAPEITSVKDVTPRTATLVFSEEIQFTDGSKELTGDDLEAIYHTNSSNFAESAEIVNGNELEVTFAEDSSLPNGTAYLYVDGETVEDLWGNQNEETLRYTADVEVDEMAPEVDSVEATAQNEITVTYSENVSDSALEEDNYELLNEDGEEVDAIDGIEWGTNDDNETVSDKVVITLDDNAYGEHTLVVDGVEDLSTNAIDSESVSFFVEDETKPAFTNFDATLFNDNEDVETVVVDFGEQMSTDGEYSVLDANKYIVNDVALTDYDDYKVSAFDNNSKVRIEIEDDTLDVSNGDTIDVARVADVAGNTTSKLSGSIEIEDEGNVGVDTVEATSNNEVEVTLNDVVTDFEADDFILTAGGNTLTKEDEELVGASITQESGKSVITFTLKDDALNDNGEYIQDDDSTDPVTVETDIESNVTTANSFGEKVQFPATTATDELSPELAVDFNNDSDPDTANVENVQATEGAVTLTFTEVINENTVNALTFEVDGFAVESATTVGDGSQVELTLTDSDAVVPFGTDVTQAYPLQDDSGNTVNDIETQVNSIDSTLPTFETYTFEDNAGNEETITISVSEAVDFADGEEVDGFSVNDDANATAVYDKDNDAIVITSSGDGNITAASTVSYDPNTGDVEDLSGNEAEETTNVAIVAAP